MSDDDDDDEDEDGGRGGRGWCIQSQECSVDAGVGCVSILDYSYSKYNDGVNQTQIPQLS